jgi:hypothetical protein
MNKSLAERPRRFQISRKGELTYDDHRFACLIQDINTKGMLIFCKHHLETGQELEVKLELEPELDFRAKIKVRHFSDGRGGAEIMEANPRSQSNWNQFMEAHFYGQLMLPERRLRL